MMITLLKYFETTEFIFSSCFSSISGSDTALIIYEGKVHGGKFCMMNVYVVGFV